MSVYREASPPPPSRDAPDEGGHPARLTRHDHITAGPAEGLARLLDLSTLWPYGEPPERSVLPPLWHWLYTLERPAQGALGEDGHPTRPQAGQLRMFAGGVVTTWRPLRLGEKLTRRTAVVESTTKQGRTGRLTFVTVRHTLLQCGETAIIDDQHIVYRQPGTPAGKQRDAATLTGEDTTVVFHTDEVSLFRFSALTYNAHRIHYDLPYARAEGYPGLVVHGPLQAILMAEACRKAGLNFTGHQFSYRLLSPAFAPQTVTAAARVGEEGADVRVADQSGHLTASATLRAFGEERLSD